jgi:hypothetical protein
VDHPMDGCDGDDKVAEAIVELFAINAGATLVE